MAHPPRFWFFLLFVFPHPALAGAWLQPLGEGLLITQGQTGQSDTIIGSKGKRRDQPTYRQSTATFYGEYGLLDQLTLGAAANYARATQQTPNGEASAHAFTEPSLFARLSLWESPTRRLSLEPVWQAPRQMYHDGGLILGNARSEFELALDYGESRALGGWDSFADLRLGLRARPGPAGNQWRGQLTLGTQPTPSLRLLGQAFSTWRTDPHSSVGFTQSSGDDYDQLRLQMSVVYDLSPGWGLQAGVYSDVYGRNLGLSDGFLFGTWWRF